MTVDAVDGQPTGQEPHGGPEGVENVEQVEHQEPGAVKPSYEDLQAQIGLLMDSVDELRQGIVARPQQTATAVEDLELDDDEPLTASKVNKIVNRSIHSAVQQSTVKSERATWDGKAKSEFPLSDPKFLREFKKDWNKLTGSGLDANHPRALFAVAEHTAARIGSKKEAPRKVDPETAHTGEVGSAEAPHRRPGGGSSRMVPENDQRVSFYNMKGDRTPKQVEAMRRKLFAKDQQSGRATR